VRRFNGYGYNFGDRQNVVKPHTTTTIIITTTTTTTTTQQQQQQQQHNNSEFQYVHQ
jgi:hypothetical protein